MYLVEAPCVGCGGGVDNDHPTTCSACLYEHATGRSYERDVDNGVIARVRADLKADNYRPSNRYYSGRLGRYV